MRHPYAMISFSLCLFVTMTVASEFFKVRPRHFDEAEHRMDSRKSSTSPTAIRAGMAATWFTWASSSCSSDSAEPPQLDSTQEVTPGFDHEDWPVRPEVADLIKGSNDNYQWGRPDY